MKTHSFPPDTLDISQVYSRNLDRIPGFRERNAQAAPIAWAQQNSTRKTATIVSGTGVLLGIAAYLLGKLNTHHPSRPRRAA